MNSATPANSKPTGANATCAVAGKNPPNTTPAIQVPVANPNSARVEGSATVAAARPSSIAISGSDNRDTTGPASVQVACFSTNVVGYVSTMSGIAASTLFHSQADR